MTTKTYTLQANAAGESLASLLRRAGIDFALPCAGNHTCGKCLLQASGRLLPPGPEELALLQPAQRAAGWRLACFAQATGQVQICLPELRQQQILSASTVRLQAAAPAMAAGHYGAAVDIGTTTVVCALYATDGSEPLAVESRLNAQARFGADVISRIACSNREGYAPLQRAILTQVEELLCQACAAAGISRSLLTHAVVTGNTTMLHFFAGLDPRGIGVAPFTPASLFDFEQEGLLAGVKVYFPPCVSAYVGADLLCCVLTAAMARGPRAGGAALLADIGTNGEMALLYNGGICCCSTAAGPAFEGAGLSQGMLAAAGAIASADYDPRQGVTYRTIANQPAQGLCGSGAIDTAAMLYRCGALRRDGRLLPEAHPLAAQMQREPTRFVFPNSNVALTQADIRQIQLAKAAIRGGMELLLAHHGLRPDELQALYVCGGFGAYLSLDAAETIGLLPANSSARVRVLGNAALSGAACLLLDSGQRAALRDVARRSAYIELSTSSAFMEHYLAAMSFGEPESVSRKK